MVGIPAVALQEGQRTSLERFDPPRSTNVADREVGRERPRRRAQQPRRDQQPDRLPRLSLRQTPRPHHHRSAQLSQRRLVQRSGGRILRAGVPGHVSRGRCQGARRRAARSTAGIRRRSQLQRRARSQSAANAPPQTILGAEQKAWFKDQLRTSKATWKIWGNSQGALDSRADPQNLPAGLTKETVAGRLLCHAARRRLRRGLRRARGDLRPRARREDHRLRHRFRRPPQLLGGLCDRGTAAGQVRARGLELRRRVARRAPGTMEALRAHVAQGPSAAPAVPRRPAGWRQARLDRQHAAPARRALLPRIREELRPRAGASAFEPDSSRRTSSSSTWAATATRRCA